MKLLLISRRLACLIVWSPITSLAQAAAIPLWPSGAPGAVHGASDSALAAASLVRITPEGEHVLTHVGEPSITPYLPSSGTGTGAAVLVIPGGGHSEIWIDHEGYAVAKWLSEHGVAAFVLQYRLAREKGSTYTVEGTELDDTQRAIRTLRSRSKEWGIDPQRIGVMGFSAGGELAELASTRSEDTAAEPADAADRLSARPNFQALLYPAIPLDPKVTSQTPPAFLACGGQDRPNISQGLPKLYLAFPDARLCGASRLRRCRSRLRCAPRKPGFRFRLDAFIP